LSLLPDGSDKSFVMNEDSYSQNAWSKANRAMTAILVYPVKKT